MASLRTVLSSSVAVVLLFGAGCITRPAGEDALPGSNAPESFGREAACRPAFADRGGWYGGDAAYSVPLPPNPRPRSLWLFGDSFVAQPGQGPGRRYPFVHNSIGVSRCQDAGAFEIEYFWRRGAGGRPRAFFAPDPAAAWVREVEADGGAEAYYWLFDGFVSGDVLFVGLLRVGEAEPRGPFALPFRLYGMDLARIENHRDRPTDWEIEISSLSDDGLAFPGAAFAIDGDYLHAFAFVDRGDGRSPRFLARLPLTALARASLDLTSEMETWTRRQGWVSGFRPEAAEILMRDDASEMSVHFDVPTARWIAVYNPPSTIDDASRESMGAASVYSRSARRLEGPWSAPVPVAEIPEMSDDSRHSKDPNLFCYAAKAHPQFSSGRRLLLTYVCNLFARSAAESLAVLERLRESPDLYRPRTLIVEPP